MLDGKVVTDVNQQSPNRKETALHFACRKDNLNVIKYLVNNGANLNLKGM